MPEWMLSDLQQQLNSAQQLLTQQSMLQSPHRMTWPHPASPSRGNRGARPLHSHISLHPDSRLADAFAIYGVPRGITQYMSKKWGQSSPRGTRTRPRVQHPGSSSSGMTAQQLREKVEAVSKASHVVLLEAMQLRAYFPPMSSPKETAELQPQLDALIQILHTHCIQVQTELGMLPEEALKKLLTSHEPREEHEEEHQTAHALYTTSEEAFPAVPASSSSSQGDTDLVAEQEAEEAAEQEAEAAKEEAEAAEQAAQESAEEAKRVAEDAAAKLAEDDTEGSSDSATGDIAASNDNSHAVQADEEEQGAARSGADHELQTAPGGSLETNHDGKEGQQAEEEQDKEEQGSRVIPDQGPEEEEGADQAQALDESELRVQQTLNPRPGSGMMDEYLKRMHWSRSSPLPTPPSPPEDTPNRVAMPRPWSKAESMHEACDARHAAPTDQLAELTAAEVPVDIVTYDDSAADHVAPVNAESAQAAFQQAGQSSMARQQDAVHPGMHIAQTGAAKPIEAESEMLTQPTHPESEDAGSEHTGSTQAERAQAESEDMIEAAPDVAETNKETQQDNESDDEVYEEVFEDASAESRSVAQPDSLAKNADQSVSSDSHPLFGDSNDEQPLPDADAESAGISRGELPSLRVGMPGQGPLQQPFTPTASPSLFSPSADMTDDVDAFSKTLNPGPVHPAKPDQAMYAAPGLAGAHHGLGVVSGTDAALTPSYRHQVRSMGQATDNEHPFRSTMPWQNGQTDTENALDDGSELVPPAPVSRQSSMGMRKLSRPSSAAISRQASMSKPASLAPSSRQASFGANGSLTSRSRQSSFGGNTAGQSAVISTQSSKAAGLRSQQSNAALAPQSGQTSIAASPIVSRQPSNVGLAALSKQPSTAAGLSKQASDMSTAKASQQSSTTGILSQQASLASVADVPMQSSNVASSELSRQVSRHPNTAASAALSRQASSGVVSTPASNAPDAALSMETSPAVPAMPAEPALVSRQSSYAPSSQEGSYAVADGVSKQPSYALSAGLSREGSYAVAAGMIKPGSGAFSKQPSYVASAELSRESSYAMTGPLSKQPSYTAVPAATASSSRRASLGARLLKETSQVLAPEDSEEQLAEADLPGGESSGRKAWRETSQPDYIEADEDWRPTSGTVSRQQSFPSDHSFTHSAVLQSGTSRQASLQASAETKVPAIPAAVSRQASVAAAPSNSKADNSISRQTADSAVTLPASKPVSRQQSLTAGATVSSSNSGCSSRAVSRQPSMAKPDNSSRAPEGRAVSRQPSAISASGSLPTLTTVSHQQSTTQATNESASSRRVSRQTSDAHVPAYSSLHTSIRVNSNDLPLSESVMRQPSVTAATSAASAGNIDAPITSSIPSRQNSGLVGGSGPASSQTVSRQASVTAAVPARLPSRQTSMTRGAVSPPVSQPVSRQASVTAVVPARAPSRQTSVSRDTAVLPMPQPVSRQASVTSTAAERVPSRQTSMTRGAASPPMSQPVSRQASVTSAAKTPARGPSRQPSVNSTSVPTSKPVSRQPSVTTAASGIGADHSLAAMHRQLSTSRKAPAVAVPPAVVPSSAVAAPVPSLRSELSMPGSIAGVSRQTSLASSIADDMLKPFTVLHPQNSATSAAASTDGFRSVSAIHDDAMSDAGHYETSHDIESATAHEKHAYLHSQHGLDDVF